MKKYFLYIIVSLLAISSNAQLPSSQRGVGLVSGNDIDSDGMYIGQAGTYPVAAMLSPSVLAQYAGCKVVGIRFAVSQNMSGSRIFLYKVEKGTIGEPMVSQSVRRASAGWNDVYFNNNFSYDITGDETLLVGYNYVETDAMVEAEEGAMCTAGTDYGSGFLMFTTFNDREGWYSMSGYGNLCIQLIVDITSLPAKDIDLSSLLIGSKFKQSTDSIDFLVLCENVGRDTIHSYSLAYQIDDRRPVVEQLGEMRDGSWGAKFAIPDGLGVGSHNFRVYVHSIDGEAPEALRNDTVSTTFLLYEHPLRRQKHYVEQYVHNRSPYVPYVSPQMDAFAATADNVALVNVSAAGNTLAVEKAAPYEALYAYTYPSFTIDRAYFYGETNIAFDVNDYVMYLPDFVSEAVRELVYEADFNPAFATVNITPRYDDQSRRLQLHVEGDVSEDAKPLFGQLGLTVVLTEDSVQSMQMVYNEVTETSSWDVLYRHNHVLRSVLTASAGDLLTLKDGRYVVDYETILPSAWNVKNLTAVAFVTKYADQVTDANVLEMDVTNCNSVSLRGVATSIDEIQNSGFKSQGDIYDLSGRKVSFSTFDTLHSLRKGLYIRNGKKILMR